LLRSAGIRCIIVLTAISGEITMRALLVAGIAFVLSIATARAAVVAPDEIKATFFNGQPFTAATPSNVKFKMVFTADGKMTRAPLAKAGARSEGTWKLSKDGFCTTWKGSGERCFKVMTAGDKKWSVMQGSTVIATWTK
jgi:hypothetical protein